MSKRVSEGSASQRSANTMCLSDACETTEDIYERKNHLRWQVDRARLTKAQLVRRTFSPRAMDTIEQQGMTRVLVRARGDRVARFLANPGYPPHMRFPVGIGDNSVEIS